jgi:hypothetical protein
MNGLGRVSVSSPILVPRPPANMTTFIIKIGAKVGVCFMK